MQEIAGASDCSRELNIYEAAILHKKDVESSLQKSEAGSRVSVLRQNGNLSRPSSLSKRGSINLSRQSLDSSKESIVYQVETNQVSRFLFSLGHLSVGALIVCVLAIQLLVSLSKGRYNSSTDSLITNSTVFLDVQEVCIALTTLVVVFNMCCLMVTSMQVFFASKLLFLSQGELRSKKYLAECSSSRFVAVMGFFISIPAFFISLILYSFLMFRSTAAIISTALLAMGILLCMMFVLQNTYQWRVEKERAEDGILSYEPACTQLNLKPSPLEIAQARNELSTLV